MAIVNLKRYRDQKVTELFDMFKLPCAIAAAPRPRPEVVGGSAAGYNDVESQRLKAVNELRRWMRPS